jgi:hypothetical protein
MRQTAPPRIVRHHNHRIKETAMYSPSIHTLLIKAHTRDLDRAVAMRRGRQPLTTPRPRRWRMRSARPSLVARFAI